MACQTGISATAPSVAVRAAGSLRVQPRLDSLGARPAVGVRAGSARRAGSCLAQRRYRCVFVVDGSIFWLHGFGEIKGAVDCATGVMERALLAGSRSAGPSRVDPCCLLSILGADRSYRSVSRRMATLPVPVPALRPSSTTIWSSLALGWAATAPPSTPSPRYRFGEGEMYLAWSYPLHPD